MFWNASGLQFHAGLFSGAIEDRHVGAFFDGTPYAPRADGGRSDRVAEVLEMMRVAALSSYENKPISTGLLLLEGDADPAAAFRRYEATRRERTARIQLTSRQNTWGRAAVDPSWVYGYNAWHTPIAAPPAVPTQPARS